MIKTLRTPQDFVAAGLAEADATDDMLEVAARYAVAMTPTLAALANAEDVRDPITLQFRPDKRELNRLPHELSDPIGDQAHEPVTGVVHRHPDRVLFKPVSVCPVYCRFCFRREMVGPDKDGALSAAEMNAAFDYIRGHEEIWEVIVTGGDPLMMSPRRIAEITDELGLISHVKTIRWHTRMPVAAPERIDDAMCRALSGQHDKAVFLAAHVNHARELSDDAVAALKLLSRAGLGLISQTVLLKDVNDTLESLSELMRALVVAGVKPYYLHQMDFAPGTSHFRVSVEEGQALVQALRDSVSGLCVPTYVIDIPGGVSKANAMPGEVAVSPEGVLVRGRDDKWRAYKD